MDKIEIWDLQRKEDARGWFLKILTGTEEFRNRLVGDVYFVCGIKNGVRGNHYHDKTNEWFCLIKGSCVLILEDIDSKKRQRVTLTENFPQLVYVPSRIAHAFYSEYDNDFIVIAFTDTIFDSNDTIKYELIP